MAKWRILSGTYYALALLVLSSMAFASYARHLSLQPINVSHLYLSIAFFITLLRPVAGIVSVLFLLHFVPALHHQLAAVANIHVAVFAHPGSDLVVGFILGSTLRLVLSSERRKYLGVPLALIPLHLFLTASLLIAITRNLHQSASWTNWSGILLNLQLVRHLDRLDDFFPLKEYFILTASLLLFVNLFAWFRPIKGQRAWQSPTIYRTIIASTIGLAAFAAVQLINGIGYSRDGFHIGVASFWPDIHSFAGIMLLPALGLFAYAKDCIGREKWLALASAAVALACIFFSGSRSTILLASAGLFFALLFRSRFSKLSFAAVAGSFCLVAAIFMVTSSNDRLMGRVSEIVNRKTPWTFSDFNVAFSYRPEIFLEAVRFSADFPFFGLGLGQFNRVSSMPTYSQSAYLVRVGGENAHNFFLQTLADFGLLGSVVLLLPFVWYRVRMPAKGPAFSCLIGLVALGLGNLYAHLFLEREALYIATFPFAVWMACAIPDRAPAAASRVNRAAALLLVALGALASYEVLASRDRLPFRRGVFCEAQRDLTADGWTGGLTQIPIEALGNFNKAALVVPGELTTRPGFALQLTLVDSDGTQREMVSISEQWPNEVRIASYLREPSDDKATVVVHTNACFVPRNLGTGDDPRRLSVRLVK